MTRNIQLRIEKFYGDNVAIKSYGDSQYKKRNLIFSPKDFVDFLKFLKEEKLSEFILELANDRAIESNKNFLR